MLVRNSKVGPKAISRARKAFRAQRLSALEPGRQSFVTIIERMPPELRVLRARGWWLTLRNYVEVPCPLCTNRPPAWFNDHLAGWCPLCRGWEVLPDLLARWFERSIEAGKALKLRAGVAITYCRDSQVSPIYDHPVHVQEIST